MSRTTYHLALSKDMLKEVRRTARETGLSMADAMRQAIKFGLPQVRARLSTEDDMSEVAADTWEKLGTAPRVNWAALKDFPWTRPGKLPH